MLPDLRDGCKVWVGGVVASAQRPPTAKGTAFLALEDEGGLINVVLRPKVYEDSRKALKSPFVVVEGRLQKQGQGISMLVRSVISSEIGAGWSGIAIAASGTLPNPADVGYNHAHTWHGGPIYARSDSQWTFGAGWPGLTGGGCLPILRWSSQEAQATEDGWSSGFSI